jgi:hypothetical protein
MSKAFGFDFVLVNNVRQYLDPEVFGGGPWIHLATVKRGLKEYMAFMKPGEQKIYIEEVDPTEPNLLKYIKDDKEYADLYRFLTDAGCLIIAGRDHEFKVAI